jgi:hypothetical protein
MLFSRFCSNVILDPTVAHRWKHLDPIVGQQQFSTMGAELWGHTDGQTDTHGQPIREAIRVLRVCLP